MRDKLKFIPSVVFQVCYTTATTPFTDKDALSSTSTLSASSKYDEGTFAVCVFYCVVMLLLFRVHIAGYAGGRPGRAC